MLIDLDGGELDELITEIDERVRRNFAGQALAVRTSDTLDRNKHQIAAVAELYREHDGASEGAFTILAFHYNLESAIGLDGDTEKTDEAAKLERFVRDQSVRAVMREALR